MQDPPTITQPGFGMEHCAGVAAEGRGEEDRDTADCQEVPATSPPMPPCTKDSQHRPTLTSVLAHLRAEPDPVAACLRMLKTACLNMGLDEGDAAFLEGAVLPDVLDELGGRQEEVAPYWDDVARNASVQSIRSITRDFMDDFHAVEVSITSTEVKAASTTRARRAQLARDWAWLFGVILFLMILAGSVGFGIYGGLMDASLAPNVMSVLGFPVFIARGSAMGIVLCTAVLYLSMSNAAISVTRWYVERWPCLVLLLDSRKEIHMFIGCVIIGLSFLHTLCHVVVTAPRASQASLEELNGLFGCATEGALIRQLAWPACPLEEVPGVWMIHLSMPFASGWAMILLLVAGAVMSTPRMRRSCFSAFRATHQCMVAAWPVLLIVHGSNNWVGAGLPLALPVFVFLVPYWAEVLTRWTRRLSSAEVVGVLVRDGPSGEAAGSLIRLDLRKPTGWRWKRCQAGMYARLCVPEISNEWHDFTISSGGEDTVSFIIEAVGDFTTKLVLLAGKDAPRVGPGVSSKPPVHPFRICLDGPITAPFQACTSYPVVVAVGAGVGVTPLLSAMEWITSSIGATGANPNVVAPREAHFFWCTRNSADFRFAAPLLTRIAEGDELREVVKPHLHLTKLPPAATPEALLWNEAVRRWNETTRDSMDRSAWPSCWVAGCDLVIGLTDTVPGGVPIILGRPKLQREIRRVGKLSPDVDVHTFVCGNKELVASLKSICEVCSQRDDKQKYVVHQERFS
mmetsp:Transcript_98202/g.225408  ORF Transcript_98202/g.225408 Transcript_98202/m.225408 type:complete len:740 (+) Transcript_98202:70-2289(+)